MSKAVVIFSGGQDSTTCLHWAMSQYSEVMAISFNYGQTHNLELESAKKICEMNISDLHEWYWKMEDILIHNHNHLINFKDTDNLPSKKIFEELYEFTK